MVDSDTLSLHCGHMTKEDDNDDESGVKLVAEVELLATAAIDDI
jgi:hypothetical protein